MESCPRCGSMIIERRKKFGCAKCSYVSKNKVKLESTEQFNEATQTAVVKEKDASTMPIIAASCPKCGNREAEFWTSQTRSGDEAETRFFRCTKCKHTWREYH